MTTATRTRAVKTATCTSQVTRQPIAPCEILPNGLAGSIIINGVSYAVSIIGELLAVGEPIIQGYRFTKADGTTYDVCRWHNHLECDCADYLYRRANTDRAGCKHVQAVRRYFQMPVELNF